MPESEEYIEQPVPPTQEAWDSFTEGGPEKLYGDDPVYNNALHKALLCETEYGRGSLALAIHHAQITLGSKSLLMTIIAGKFDKTEILAKMSDDDIKIANLDLELILTQAMISMPECDRDKPELINIINMIRDHYNKFVTRASGAFERKLQNVSETSHRQEMVQKVAYPMPQQRKGFRLPFTGK